MFIIVPDLQVAFNNCERLISIFSGMQEQSLVPKQIELWHSCWLIMFISPISKLTLQINEFQPIYNT